jgi:glycosyltransferase involved in cell wall biosynthesis
MQGWQLAKHLTARGHAVEILTTCCRSFEDDWSTNFHRPGLTVEDGITLRRFRVERRDRAAFGRADHALLTTPKTNLRIGVNPVTDEEARTFASEGIRSKTLLDYLARMSERYAVFVFMQYLYGTTLQGLPLVAGRAFLQPTLHDEAYAYIPEVAATFQQARGLLFISAGEFELAQRLFGPGIIPKSHVVGAGVDEAARASVTAVREFDPRNERFVLYLGRQEPSKNVDLLLAGFKAYRSRRPLSSLKLVLAGQHGHSQINSSNGVVNLGPVTDEEKEALLDGCRALAQPSVNESYSRVMIESWMHGRPVVVHADCIATAVPVHEADAGWVAGDVDEWSRVLEALDVADDRTLRERGARGRRYSEEYGNWDKVIARYEQALGAEPETRLQGDRARVDPREWDVLPDRQLIAALQDGRTNIMYAGAFPAFEPLGELIEAFLHYLTLERHSRLVLLGPDRVDPLVYERLVRQIDSLQLNDNVVLTAALPPPQRLAVYRTSRLFWSMEAGGPGDELLTAMWFDIPILAFKNATSSQIAGDSSILFTSKGDLLATAALAKIITHDERLRASIVGKQRERRELLTYGTVNATRLAIT